MGDKINYFILVLNYLNDDLSLIESDDILEFNFDLNNKYGDFNISINDCIIGYNKNSKTLNYLFVIKDIKENGLILEKILSVSRGASIEEKSFEEMLEDTDIIQIEEETFKDFYNSLISNIPNKFDQLNNLKVCNYKDRKPGGNNKLYYGVPGSGKSHKINKDLVGVKESQKERIIFHPDYTYSDFVGQILPKINDKEQITYEFTPGPFTRILEKAFHNSEKPYYLIIEEINRGNAPAIFGDIFQLLDRVKPKIGSSENSNDEEKMLPVGTSEYYITNSYIANEIYNKNEHNIYGDKVRIPSNLFILASMNTSDQNVFTLDTAFQRRWDMELIKNDFKEGHEFKDDVIFGTGVTWEVFQKAINKAILEKNQSKISSEDKRLGTYFIQKSDLEEGNIKKFSEKVIKYLWDDAFKFSRGEVFDVEEYSLEYVVKQFEEKEDLDIFKSFITDKIKEEKQNINSSSNIQQSEDEQEQEENNDSE